ncbi:MAG: hypothetical protein ACYC46_10090 [Acidobacteriaceae bacterium]
MRWKKGTVARRVSVTLILLLYFSAMRAAHAVDGAAAAASPRQPQPEIRISLDDLGYMTPAQDYRLLGYSMMSVSFVDSGHLLFTFNPRKLMRRVPNDPPDDNDQVITALLLQLPTGKVVARTDWRMHDHAQYLWPLGHGRFLLRQGRQLGLLDPIEQLKEYPADLAAPLRPQPFITLPGPLELLRVAPDHHLLVMETKRLLPPAQINVGPQSSGPPSLIPRGSAPDSAAAQQEQQYNGVDILFLDLNFDNGPGYNIVGRSATPLPVDVPAIRNGLLMVSQEQARHWLFTFDSLSSNNNTDLFDYISGCRPYPIFLDMQQFLTLGCDDESGDRVRMSVFNLQGDVLWQQKLSGSYIWPKVESAPEAARFALSRVMTEYPVYATDDVSPQLLTGQEISVLDTLTGALALRVQLAEPFRDGGDFSLAPDGSRLAVVDGDQIEVYNLPPVGLGPAPKK